MPFLANWHLCDAGCGEVFKTYFCKQCNKFQLNYCKGCHNQMHDDIRKENNLQRYNSRDNHA